MRSLLLGFCGAVALAGSAVAERSLDLFEVGGNFGQRMDRGIFVNNDDVVYTSGRASVFPVIGDFGKDLGLNLGVGHTFSGRRANYSVLIKYFYRTTSEAGGSKVWLENNQAVQRRNTGYIREHDLLLTFRIASLVFPYDWMHLDRLNLDLGFGVGTVVYDYLSAERNLSHYTTGVYYAGPNDRFSPFVEHERVRSGLIANVGLGYKIPLMETVDISTRIDFLFGRVQDIEDARGNLVHEGPGLGSTIFSLNLVKRFNSLF
jgi:hypothetical protein